jgi:hypothetical protein
MTSDLTDRLRLAAKPEDIASVWGLTVVRCSLLRDAADEIERLRERVGELEHDSQAATGGQP